MRWTAQGACMAAVLAGALLAPVSAHAQRIEPPQGCTAFLTVQSKSCSVSHYWRCDEGLDGAAWAANYDDGGPVSLSLFDSEFQWIDSQRVSDASREFLTDASDPASMSELLETGRDTYDFVMREEGPDGRRDVRHVGYDELSGRTVEIDGVELLETVFASIATDVESGEEIYSVTGQQYVLAEERLFFLGRDTFSQNGRAVTSDGSPVRFYRPGDAGFAAMTPTYECDDPTDIGYGLDLRQ